MIQLDPLCLFQPVSSELHRRFPVESQESYNYQHKFSKRRNKKPTREQRSVDLNCKRLITFEDNEDKSEKKNKLEKKGNQSANLLINSDYSNHSTKINY